MTVEQGSLPLYVGLCPDHTVEFYMPLDDDSPSTCPECDETLIVYGPRPQTDAEYDERDGHA